MAVTAATVAAAATMLAALAAIFLSFVLCFYIFLCAKRSRGGGAPPPPGSGVAARMRFFLFGGGGGRGGEDGATAWRYDGGLDEASVAALPTREVAKGEAMDCAVCITELAAGETARVLPRCGHGFHVDCVDMWLRSHSTCPLCRCPAVDEPPVRPAPAAVQAPEADPESPNFPTNVLFFGSQDDVSTGGTQPQQQPPSVTMPPPMPTPSQAPPAGVRGLRRLLGCGSASPPQQRPHPREEDAVRDIEMGLAGGESSVSRPPKPPQLGSS